MREPAGSCRKRGDESPSRVAVGVGVGESTWRKRAAVLARGLVVETSSEGLPSGLRTVRAAGSGPAAIRTSCHPWSVLCGLEFSGPLTDIDAEQQMN